MPVISDRSQGFVETDDTAITREYDAIPRSVRQARETVAAFAEHHGADDETVDDIRTAISEAATNVVTHAYANASAGRFRLLAIVRGGYLLVIIDDDGRGMNSPSLCPGLGMGQHVMQESAEQALFLNRDSSGSSVQLRFLLEA